MRATVLSERRARNRGWAGGGAFTAVLTGWIVCICALAVPAAHAQEWCWTALQGTLDFGYGAVFGTQGVADAANHPSDRAYGYVSWTGPDGALYLFGGQGYGSSTGNWGYLAALWRYNPASNQWTWIKGSKTVSTRGIYGVRGVSAPANMPGGRMDSMAWAGSDGKAYLFGGDGVDDTGTWGYLNDLWRYDSATNQWTWIKGSSSSVPPGVYGTPGTPAAANTPGGRSSAAVWTGRDGMLYLFGGAGHDGAGVSGLLNDLWKYDPATNQWTWLTGASTTNASPVYGAQGTPAPANTPGARRGAVSWTGADGALYLFGGLGFDDTGQCSILNDLWRYNPGTNQWTWLKGANTVNQAGTYGARGTPAPANTPGSRHRLVSWTGSDGALYLFGGWGMHILACPGYLNDLWKYDPGANQWTWLRGSNIATELGRYGRQGTPAAGNVPGARHLAVSWTGKDGTFYLYGGSGCDALRADASLNDLWRYDRAANQWTWLRGPCMRCQPGVYGSQGTPDSANTPGGRRHAVSWTGNDGRFYLFGGSGNDSTGADGYLNDLWRYSRAMNQWTWLKGANTCGQTGTYGIQGTPAPANTPGARRGAVSWTGTDGALYLFGGSGSLGSGTFGPLNDLWEFDPATAQWTWIKGASTANHGGIYGTQGTPAPDNTPGTREFAVSWTGTDGALYLFGGEGHDSTGRVGVQNDLWEFDPAANQWVWIKGANTIDQWGNYGIQEAPDMANTPGARRAAVSWTGADGLLYLFGGWGFDSAGAWGYLNDLWRYNPATSQWTWLKGAVTINAGGIYGIRGTPASDNTPGNRQYGVSWTGRDGALFLFGGSSFVLFNDLWRYDPALNQWAWIKGADTCFQYGTCATPGVPSWVNTPGARYGAVGWTGADDALYLFGGSGNDCGFGCSDDLGDVWRFAPIPAKADGTWLLY